jgi:hypothetical protein
MASFGQEDQKSPFTINGYYSSLAGTDKRDSARLMRYFNNFYGIFQLSESAGLTIGLDYGLEEKYLNEKGFNIWYSPVIIFQLKLSHKVITTIRGEYYCDKQGVIVDSSTPMGFKVTVFRPTWITR